jgi:hypothetical protein
MSKKTVSYSLATLPPLTEEQRLHLEQLAALSDEHIQTGDIPELTDNQLAEMRPVSWFRKGQSSHGT